MEGAETSTTIGGLQQELRETKKALEEAQKQHLVVPSPFASTSQQHLEQLEQQQQQQKEKDEEIERLRAEVAKTKETLATQQQALARLKNQMLNEQDDEEEKVRWRVEAEVKLALEKFQLANFSLHNGNGGGSNIKDVIEVAKRRAESAEEEAARWEKTAAAKDAELANLQRALGEMSYETEVAERLRGELRAMQAEMHRLRNEVDTAKVATMQAEKSLEVAQAEVVAARNDALAARGAEAEARREVLAAQMTAQEALRELKELKRGGGAVPRVTVIQAVQGMVKMKRPRDVLREAQSAFQLTDQEVEEIKKAAVVGGSGSGGDGQSLASSWIDFLESVVAKEDDDVPIPVGEFKNKYVVSGSAVPVAAPSPSPASLSQGSAAPPTT